MKKNLVIMCIFLGILLLVSLDTSVSQMMGSAGVGVAQGDVFRYGYLCYFNSSDPHAVPPSSLYAINQTDYFMVNITGVSGVSVNFETMLRGLSGDSHTGVCSMNVDTGIASISGYGGPNDLDNFFFMAKNVGMMGRMFPSSSFSPTINDTFSMPYLSGSRITNHFARSTSSNGTTVNSDFYFDQATGMMVEWREETVQTSGAFQTNSTQMMKIVSSNIWTIPEFPISVSTALIAFGFIVSLAVVAVIKTKRVALRSL